MLCEVDGSPGWTSKSALTSTVSAQLLSPPLEAMLPPYSCSPVHHPPLLSLRLLLPLFLPLLLGVTVMAVSLVVGWGYV